MIIHEHNNDWILKLATCQYKFFNSLVQKLFCRWRHGFELETSLCWWIVCVWQRDACRYNESVGDYSSKCYFQWGYCKFLWLSYACSTSIILASLPALPCIVLIFSLEIRFQLLISFLWLSCACSTTFVVILLRVSLSVFVYTGFYLN